MSEQQQNDSKSNRDAFEEAGRDQQMSLASEFLMFVKENKKWWLIPILIVFGAVSLLIVLGSTGAAPFIYTLF